MKKLQLLDLFLSNYSIRKSLILNYRQNNSQAFFGKYKIKKLIGIGTFAQVYKATNIDTGKDVALKIVDIEQLTKKYPGQQARQKLNRSLSDQENNLKKCHSAHVVKFYQSFENSKCKVFVLEYCSQGSLENFLKKKGRLEEEEAISILKQIICGVAEMHRNRIIHRDMKPANILIHKGVVKISDFGFSKQIRSEQEVRRHTCLGTRGTMAPEVTKDQGYGLKSDIWSIGIIFFLMLSYNSALSFKKNFDDFQKIVEKEDRLREYLSLNDSMSLEVKDFLKKTLELDQDKRLSWEQTLSHCMFFKNSEGLSASFLKAIDFDQKQEGRRVDCEIAQNNQVIKRYCQQQMNAFSAINQHLLSLIFVQCQRVEFMFDKLIIPLEQQEKFDQKCHYFIELLYLLVRRCKVSIDFIERNIKEKLSEIIREAFIDRMSLLHERLRLKIEHYSELLKGYEGKISTIIKGQIWKLVRSKQWSERERIIHGVEGVDFQWTEQVDYTYQRYILNCIGKLQGGQNDNQQLISHLKGYRQIFSLDETNSDEVDLTEDFKNKSTMAL